MKLFLIFTFFFIFINVFGQRLKIKIFSDINVKSFVFASNSGKYNVYSDTVLIITLNKDEALNIMQKNDSIEIKT